MHSRIQYCFSIHGLGKEVWWSFALERAQWLILLHNFGVQFISFKLGKLKLLWMGEKVKLNVSTKAVTRGCKLWPLKEQFKEQFEWMSLKFVQFSHTSSISCSICSNLPLYQVIFKCYFKNHLLPAAAKCIVNQWNDESDYCQWRLKWSKFGTLYLLNK